MMISEVYECVWIIPEGCESKNIDKILKNFEFKKSDGSLSSYSNYKIISSIKNPYDRVFNLYKKYKINDIVIKKDMSKVVFKDFNIWIDMTFTVKKFNVDTSKLYDKNWEPYETQLYISDWKFDKIIPNYFVRLEDLENDLRNIDFISKFEIESDTYDDEYKSYYVYDSAKKVFEYYKKHFYLGGYNPFSYCSENINENDKINFIHNVL